MLEVPIVFHHICNINFLPSRSITAVTKISMGIVEITARNRNVTQMPDSVHQGRPKFEIKIAPSH